MNAYLGEMMHTRIPTSLALVCSLSILSVSEVKSHSQETRFSPIGVTLKLDRQEVVVGETVRISETVPADRKVLLSSISHETYLVGKFDERTGKMVSLPRFWFEPVFPHDAFDDLHDNLQISHPIDFNSPVMNELKTPREKGWEFNFIPKRVGVYLIRSEWRFRNEKESLSSQPIILTVNPPRDAKGNPYVKPEWLHPESKVVVTSEMHGSVEKSKDGKEAFVTVLEGKNQAKYFFDQESIRKFETKLNEARGNAIVTGTTYEKNGRFWVKVSSLRFVSK